MPTAHVEVRRSFLFLSRLMTTVTLDQVDDGGGRHSTVVLVIPCLSPTRSDAEVAMKSVATSASHTQIPMEVIPMSMMTKIDDPLPALMAEVAEMDKRVSRFQTRLSKLRQEQDELRERFQSECCDFGMGKGSYPAPVFSELKIRDAEIEVVKGQLDKIRADRERFYLEQVEPLLRAKAAAERKRRIEELRAAHEADLQQERECERKLFAAKENSNRSYFAWRAVVDQEALDAQQTALDQAKREWQLEAGRNVGLRASAAMGAQ